MSSVGSGFRLSKSRGVRNMRMCLAALHDCVAGHYPAMNTRAPLSTIFSEFIDFITQPAKFMS